MLAGWPIKKKLALGGGLLLFAVTTLAVAGFHNVYSFRGLARSISRRASELPVAVSLAAQVSRLQTCIPGRPFDESYQFDSFADVEFSQQIVEVTATLARYRKILESNASTSHAYIGDIGREMETVQELEAGLTQIKNLRNDANNRWPEDDLTHETLVDTVALMNQYADPLPRYLQERMLALQREVRGYYRMWIVVTWITSIVAAVLIFVLIQLFYRWVLQPMRQLINGSRLIAADGDFRYRIRLNSGDEMEELAKALNDMTDRFEQIRDDLDRQVKQRTREVIRGEQLASVGFLAAGVAHEINNPLASIALCAESLEERIAELIQMVDRSQPCSASHADTPLDTISPRASVLPDEPSPESASELGSSDEPDSDADIVRDYLRMIQAEAFRCKGITEKLLDFSRLGDSQRQQTNLCELIEDVVEMVGHVGKYKHKEIRFKPGEPTWVHVNPQELKQVVLNLITNGLESLQPGGCVAIALRVANDEAVLEVCDNGCGMTEEVRAHLFEPFFTRRRDGQGTGLGMSISYRIITEHGGQIDVASDGPNCGSTITVRLPLKAESDLPQQKETNYQRVA